MTATTTKNGHAALNFNHAMIYSRDVSRALGFYRDLLGLPGMCLTQVGTVSQRFVWLAHWRLRPASSSGTKASRAVQGDRPTLVSCCRSNYLSEAHTHFGFYTP